MGKNENSRGEDQSPAYPVSPGESALPGLTALLKAYHYARDAGADLWDFALELDQLYEIGLTISDARWLVARGLAEHGNEVSVYGDQHRSFESSVGLNFEARTCLVLTADGAKYVVSFATQLLEKDDSDGKPRSAGGEAAETSGEDSPRPSGVSSSLFLPVVTLAKPRWDAARRELHFGDVLVKRFRVPARNQEWILEVFEEDEWPEYIDDPLPPSADVDPRTRLHDAINRLNGSQVNPMIRFHGNGSGKGVYWEAVVRSADGIVAGTLGATG